MVVDIFTKLPKTPPPPHFHHTIKKLPTALLYDTGSQFPIITRQTYYSLPCKPPLVEVKQSGIDIDGLKFTFEGVAYLTLNFKKFDGTDYSLYYGPILVSNHMKSHILGAITESRFKSFTRDFKQQTLVYTTT